MSEEYAAVLEIELEESKERIAELEDIALLAVDGLCEVRVLMKSYLYNGFTGDAVLQIAIAICGELIAQINADRL